ncbi:MAG: DUF72 domain-containing protein [Actinomycetota bacterium]
MWAHRPWIGRYLPSDTPQGAELAAYARLCTAVEGNTTFYALPSPDTADRWAASMPDGFLLVPKLPKELTHDRRLRSGEGLLRESLDRFTRLGDRLGPVTVQLPASFGPDDLRVLEDFLRAASGEVRWAVEVRHPAFHDGGDDQRRLDQLLHELGVERVLLDTRALFAGPCETRAEVEAFERKPRLQVRPVATGWQPIVRFIGQRDLGVNERFWAPWVDRVVDWLAAGLSPIVFLHTPDNDHAPALARRFHAAVADRLPDLAPLPEPLPVERQTGLF